MPHFRNTQDFVGIHILDIGEEPIIESEDSFTKSMSDLESESEKDDEERKGDNNEGQNNNNNMLFLT